MKFKDFEIRPVKSIDGVIDPNRFELVKWYDHGHCFVVAWLEWNDKEPCFELASVGLRLVENWVDGLDKFILKWCEMAEVCMEDNKRMKSDELYVLISNWRKEMEEVGKMGCVAEMGQVMLELREDIYANEQKSAGKSGKAIVSAAKRIVKSAKATKRDNISGVFSNIDKDGTEHWCVCDGYVGVRFNEPMPLEEADTSKCEPFDMSQICRMPDNAKELDLPSLAEVKVYAKTNRVNDDRNGGTKPKPMKIDAEIGLWVNPELLINIMECLPDAKAWATTRISGIYFKADNGDGVLMPVNHKEDNE